MNEFALITGASSGIGLHLAQIFAENGFSLILVARNKDRLNALAEEIKKKYKVDVLAISKDLSQGESAEDLFKEVKEEGVEVKYLINNAGFYVKGKFSETSMEETQKLIQLQCLTHTRLTRLFLTGMLERGEGGILNTGSTGSFVPGPFNAVYCAVKAYVLSFSQAIAEELSGSGVKVTALCPGGTHTSFQDTGKRKNSVFFPLLEPSKVARAGYKGLMKGKRIVIPGFGYKLQVFLIRFVPGKLMVKLAATMVRQPNG